jgi:(R,R)-butanediol dehydrogenase / meso-butanediol dehydrogenase / diacetyl reductase
MKALVFHGREDLRYQDLPEPVPGPHEVLIKVKSSGLCHTDFNEYRNGPLFVSASPHPRTGRAIPLVLGHEFSGQVVTVGPRVKRVKVNDRVAVNAVDGCGSCVFCHKQQFALCTTAAYIGFGRDGGFADFAAVPEKCCYGLGNVSWRAGALVEPLSVAVHAVRRSKLEMANTVAVIGGGTVGLCVLQAARCAGARCVFVIEKSESKRHYAEVLGADAFLNSDRVDVVQEIAGHTEELGVDIAFECAGSAAALNTAVQVTRKGGTICVVGLFPGPAPFDWNVIVGAEKSIIAALAYGIEYPTTIAMLQDGRLRADEMITGTVPLSEASDHLKNFEAAGRQGIKTLIEL